MAIVLEPGTLVADRYRLDRMLGQGGMGVVWAATHAVTRRTVAMKFVRSTLQQKAELRRRLLREAHAAAAVRHPNVVEILDVFELDADTPVIVMTLLHGETLGQRLARDKPLSLADAASFLLPAISAIGTAHARGIIHRDLKPDNIYLSEGPDGAVVKVLDFGIAKLQGIEHAPHDSMSTQTGSTLGTPSYMAPEQAAGEKDVDHRADIWALGVIAYECLSGERPIEGENAGQVIMRLMTTGITPLSRVTRGLPKDVTSLVDRMLSREPKRRCQDLREARNMFARYAKTPAQEFGQPGSEMSTAFERDSRRSTEPVAFSHRPPAEDHLATLVNAAPAFRSASVGRQPVERRVHGRLKALGIVAASSVVALSVWRLVRASDTTSASFTPASSSSAAATPGEGGRALPQPSATRDAASTAAPMLTGPEGPRSSALPASSKPEPPTALKKRSPQSARAIGGPPLQVPDAAASSLPAASSSAHEAPAHPRSRGLVDEVPF